jgi:hypothetical protein
VVGRRAVVSRPALARITPRAAILQRGARALFQRQPQARSHGRLGQRFRHAVGAYPAFSESSVRQRDSGQWLPLAGGAMALPGDQAQRRGGGLWRGGDDALVRQDRRWFQGPLGLAVHARTGRASRGVRADQARRDARGFRRGHRPVPALGFTRGPNDPSDDRFRQRLLSGHGGTELRDRRPDHGRAALVRIRQVAGRLAAAAGHTAAESRQRSVAERLARIVHVLRFPGGVRR